MDTRRVVCGVTLLDLDHTRVLGDTLEKIAWEKGGIFQIKKGDHGSGISTAPQGDERNSVKTRQGGANRFFAIGTNTPSALKVLQDCAVYEGQGGRLVIVNEYDDLLGTIRRGDWAPGITPTYQRSTGYPFPATPFQKIHSTMKYCMILLFAWFFSFCRVI